MSSQQMLNQLEQRLQRLAQALAPLAEQPAARSRFDRALFLTHGTRLKDYLQETRDNFTALQRAVGAGQRQQVAFLAERLLPPYSASKPPRRCGDKSRSGRRARAICTRSWRATRTMSGVCKPWCVSVSCA